MTLFFLFSGMASASPLVNQWAGTGMDADKFICEYGDGQIIVIYGNQKLSFFKLNQLLTQEHRIRHQ
ncbi:MAG: hypothetical protein Q9N32_04495 [Gammaproteobacteria bacterium]|nr:hypothetical protein [Gammaproteobacteria bacterium]